MPGFADDPAVWGVCVAVAALILSQLPPLRELLKGVRLSLLLPEQFQLHHILGNVNVTLWIDIVNLGGRNARIQKVDCYIVDDERSNCVYIPAVSYWRNRGDQAPIEIPIGAIVLKSDDHWAETLHCYRSWTDREEEEVSEIIVAIRESISAKVQPGQTAAQEADSDLVAKAEQFFERKFPLAKGHYRLVIALLGGSPEPLLVEAFAFTLYESHIRALRSSVDQYKYGSGIYFANPQLANVWPRMRRLNAADASETYKWCLSR